MGLIYLYYAAAWFTQSTIQNSCHIKISPQTCITHNEFKGDKFDISSIL